MIATALLLLLVLVALGALGILLLAVYCPVAYRNGYAAGQADARRKTSPSNVVVLPRQAKGSGA